MPKAAKIPNPGSSAARRKGCHCSPEANHQGAKRPERGWFVTALCPLHTLDGDGDFRDVPRIEVYRRNAAKARALADQLDALAEQLKKGGDANPNE